MDQATVEMDEIRIVGIQVRTSNEAEKDSSTALIPGLWKRFYQEHVLETIPGVKPGFLYEAYLDYESDHTGEYSVVLGAEVAADADVPSGMVSINLPRSRYLVFDASGDLPQSVQKAWARVWSHFDSTDPRARAYSGDFERFRIDENGGFAECHLYISLAAPHSVASP